MKNTIFFIACILFSQTLFAQIQRDEIPESVQLEINQKLAIYKNKLGELKAWLNYKNQTNTNIATANNHVLFRWPMRVNANYDDVPDYYTLSNYMDVNRETENGCSKDWRCNNCSAALNYRYHEGNDYSLFPFTWRMLNNGNVFAAAAAPGIVVGVRDNQDNSYNCKVDSTENPAGNFVAVLNADSSISRYYHIKMGSAKVVEGQFVDEGQLLATVASSGRSSNPHLHFDLQDFKDTDGQYGFIEPFDRLTDNTVGQGCNPAITASRWQNQKTYVNPTLNRVMTHSGVPELVGYVNSNPTYNFCPEFENAKAKNRFERNDVLVVGTALSHVGRQDSVHIRILYPNQTQWTSTPVPVPNTGGFPVNGWFREIYLTKIFGIPADAPIGTYTIITDFVYKPYDDNAMFGPYYPETDYVQKTFKSYFTVGCVNSQTLTGTNTFGLSYIVANDLISTQQVTGSNKTMYQSANYIQLNPGFTALQGTTFKARIRDCNFSD